MQFEDVENPYNLSASNWQEKTNQRSVILQKTNEIFKEEEYQSSQAEGQTQNHLSEHSETSNLEFQRSSEIEHDQIQISTDDHERKDDESELLALWYGNPQRDIMTAEDWLQSVQNAKGKQFPTYKDSFFYENGSK
jgi:hypothetical protein